MRGSYASLWIPRMRGSWQVIRRFHTCNSGSGKHSGSRCMDRKKKLKHRDGHRKKAISFLWFYSHAHFQNVCALLQCYEEDGRQRILHTVSFLSSPALGLLNCITKDTFLCHIIIIPQITRKINFWL